MKLPSLRKIFRSRFPWIFALLMSAFYILAPWLGEQIGESYLTRSNTRYVNQVVNYVQNGLTFPLSTWVPLVGLKQALVFPWFVLTGYVLRLIYLVLKPIYKYVLGGMIGLLLLLRIFPGILMMGESDAASTSIGTVANGHLENGKRIPFSGENYCTYTFWGYLAGRTFVHDKVRTAVLEAYASCAEKLPDKEFVLMETGFRKGGRFLPHKTHRSGMSVDFMTPQVKNGSPYDNRHLFNLWGYRREFDDTGKMGDIEIDYEVMAQHLLYLYEAAGKNGLRIKKVIFDPVLQPYLFQTPTGKKLKGKFYFTRGRVVVRHDDHYHVDFELR